VLELPSQTLTERIVTLGPLERSFYDSLFGYFQSRVRKYLDRLDDLKRERRAEQYHRRDAAYGRWALNAQEREQNARASVLQYIMRLRQACVTPFLVIYRMPRLSHLEVASSRSWQCDWCHWSVFKNA
jgi:SNF2 family DNA or RNA helicase